MEINRILCPVVTIDGHSGAGKGTLAKQLANALGWHLLESGFFYRLLAWQAAKHHLVLEEEQPLEQLARAIDPFTLETAMASQETWDGQRFVDWIRTESCGKIASHIAILPKVRAALLDKQRSLVRPPGLIADGRDMGTIVFPEAPLKIFLTASPKARAERRYLELKARGEDVTLAALLAEMEARDRRDKERLVAPLRPAEDAVVVDTTLMSVKEAFDKGLSLVRQVGLGGLDSAP